MNEMEKQSAEVINRLFSELKSIFANFWTSGTKQAELETMKRTWMKAFIEANLTSWGKIEFGLKKCRSCESNFPPTPGQFIAWCKPTPEEYGIPPVREAYRIACIASGKHSDKNWVHDVIFHAAQQTTTWDLSTKPEEQTYKIFERNYEIALRDWLDGKPLQSIPIAIEHQTTPPTDASREVGKRHLADMLKHLRGERKSE